MDDYPTFKTLNQRVIKPAIQEIIVKSTIT